MGAHRIINLCSTICLSMIIISCTDEEAYTFENEVDTELIQYFHSFAEEALERDVVINWDEEQLSASLMEITGDAVGQCLTYDNGNRRINVDQNFWQASNTLAKEFLIFHELGHCVLGRAHYDESNSNGSCLSMMTSGEGSCRANYNNRTREEYLDELFLN